MVWYISNIIIPSTWSKHQKLLNTPFLAQINAALGSAGDTSSSQLWDRLWIQDLPLYSLAPSLLWIFPQTHRPMALTQTFIMSLAAYPFFLTNFFIWEQSLNGTQPPDISLLPLTKSFLNFQNLRELHSRRLLFRDFHFLLHANASLLVTAGGYITVFSFHLTISIPSLSCFSK